MANCLEYATVLHTWFHDPWRWPENTDNSHKCKILKRSDRIAQTFADSETTTVPVG